MPQRVIGIDVARAIALLAMMAAHLTTTGAFVEGIGGELLYGFPSALFAFLAGMSMSLMARTAGSFTFCVRAAVLIAFHLLLLPFSGDIAIVLFPMGISMIMLSVPVSWSSRSLALLFVALCVVSAVINQFEVEPWFLLGPPYPLAMWAALMTAGILAHRHLRAYAVAALSGGVVAAAVLAARWYYLPPDGWDWLDPNGHTGGLLDVAGSVGMSVAIVSICCLVYSRLGRSPILQPCGSMSMTVYVLHVLTADYLGFTSTAIGAIVFAAVWKHFFQRGPLEAFTRWVVNSAVTRRSESADQPRR